jgi:DME family drug/metabolite transporter
LGASLYKKGVHDMPTLTFNFIRSTLVTFYAFLILFFLGNWNSIFTIDLITLAIMGISSILVLAVGDTLYFIGLKTIGVTKTVPIAYSYSILVIFLSALILEEEITLAIVLGTSAIILGVWLVANKALDQTQNSKSSLIGVLASVGTTLCWGFGVVLFKIILNNNDPFVLTAGRMIFLLPTLAMVSIIFNFKKSSRKKWTKNQIILALFSGLIALGIGDTLLYLGLDSANINIVTPLTSTTPIFSAIIAVLFLGENASKKIIIGTILVTTGTMLLFIK